MIWLKTNDKSNYFICRFITKILYLKTFSYLLHWSHSLLLSKKKRSHWGQYYSLLSCLLLSIYISEVCEISVMNWLLAPKWIRFVQKSTKKCLIKWESIFFLFNFIYSFDFLCRKLRRMKKKYNVCVYIHVRKYICKMNNDYVITWIFDSSWEWLQILIEKWNWTNQIRYFMKENDQTNKFSKERRIIVRISEEKKTIASKVTKKMLRNYDFLILQLNKFKYFVLFFLFVFVSVLFHVF